jgi:hypothetical protein
MRALQTIDAAELVTVTGGELSLGSLGQSFLSGFLSNGAQSVQSGQGIQGFFNSALKGGFTGLASTFIGQLFGGGQTSSSSGSSSAASSSPMSSMSTLFSAPMGQAAQR